MEYTEHYLPFIKIAIVKYIEHRKNRFRKRVHYDTIYHMLRRRIPSHHLNNEELIKVLTQALTELEQSGKIYIDGRGYIMHPDIREVKHG